MGLQNCACRAEFQVEGDLNLVVTNLSYEASINICPDCTLDGSEVSANVVSDGLFPPLNATFSFEGAPVGLPMCENGVLEVDVEGTAVVNGTELNVTITLRLDSNEGRICITLPENIVDLLPNIVPNPLCLPVQGLMVVECDSVG